MRLQPFDEKCVRITLTNGDVFEGVCCYNSRDYNEHEFGRAEDALQMANFIFYRSDILQIESLEERQGPYGHFSAPFGLLEEINARDGVDFIRAVIEYEEEVNTLRMLRCVDSFLERGELRAEEVLPAVREVPSFYDDPELLAEAERLLRKWG